MQNHSAKCFYFAIDKKQRMPYIKNMKQENLPLPIHDIGEIRRRNLRSLVARFKPATKFLTALRKGSVAHGAPMIWSPGMLSAVAGPNPSRPVSEKSARRIERAMGLPNGALDQPSECEVDRLLEAPLPMAGGDRSAVKPATQLTQSDASAPPALKTDEARLLSEAMQAVTQAVEAYGNDAFNPGRHGRVVYAAFEHAKKTGKVDMDFVEGLLSFLYE